MNQQLALNLFLRDDSTFENFYVGPNPEVCTYLQEMLQGKGDRFIYLWGCRGSGRSHLLQACCHLASEINFSTVYLPLAQEEEPLSPDVLSGLEWVDMVCLDDIDAIAKQPAWEEAFFHLYNRIIDGQTKLVVTASLPPREMIFQLPDLISRLSAAVIFQVQPLNVEEKLKAIKLHAKMRGMHLVDEVGFYLIRRTNGNLMRACQYLERLDRVSLAQRRRLSLSFVKQFCNEMELSA